MRWVILALWVAVAPTLASAGIVNGDFENGQAGWESMVPQPIEPAPYGGHWLRWHSATGNEDAGGIQQVLTVTKLSHLTADYSWDLSASGGGVANAGFWLYGDTAATIGKSVGDNGETDSISSGQAVFSTYLKPGWYIFGVAYSGGTYSPVPPTAQWDATFTLDNVTLTAVPEPSGWLLLLLGVACLYGLRKTK